MTGFSAKQGARSGIMKPVLWHNAGSSSCAADANVNYCLYFLSGPQNSRQFSSFLCIKVNTSGSTSWNLAAGIPTRYGLDGTLSNSGGVREIYPQSFWPAATPTHPHRGSFSWIKLPGRNVDQRCSTAGPRSGTGPWHQLYRAARGLRKLQYATKFH